MTERASQGGCYRSVSCPVVSTDQILSCPVAAGRDQRITTTAVLPRCSGRFEWLQT